MKKTAPKISKRLLKVASFVRKDARVADIGTDHCLLPIYLVMNGKINFAVATDINEGPLEVANKNINKYGLSDKITTFRTDGLLGVGVYEPTDVLICGMGGDLIAEITNQANDCNIKSTSVQLVLQPMTHFQELRLFLLKNGFEIIDEAIIKDEKFYQIIVARFSGSGRDFSLGYSEVELLLGRVNIQKRKEEFIQYIHYLYGVWSARIHGKRKAGLNFKYEEDVLSEFDKIIKGENL